MKFLLLVIALFACAFVSAYYGRNVSNNMGRNIGNSYMKKHWGIDEDNK